MTIRLGDTTVRRRADRLWIAGAGKAAARMAAAVAALIPEARGVVIAPRGERTATRSRVGRIVVLPGDHPVPGAASFGSTARLLAELDRQPADATVLFLLSGGASALLAAPAAGLRRRDKVALNQHLLRCGAPIAVMNTLRKHVSAVKGGWLALRAAPRAVVTLALSDVPGDDPATIGSGPTVADPTTFADARRLLRATAGAASAVPEAVWHRLERGARRHEPDTPKPGDPRLGATHFALLGSNATALAAAAAAAAARGYQVRRLRRALAGEAAACARRLVGRLPAEPRRPTCVLAGGETFVTAAGSSGIGGRCQEMALAAATGLAGTGWSVLFAGTDGRDGPTDAAGGFCDGSTLPRAGAARLRAALAGHDSHPLLRALGDDFRPGPTGTNVMDVAIALHPGRGARRAR